MYIVLIILLGVLRIPATTLIWDVISLIQVEKHKSLLLGELYPEPILEERLIIGTQKTLSGFQAF